MDSIWNKPLTEKSSSYYGIAKFSGPEHTWKAYFKAMKCLENAAAMASDGKCDIKSAMNLKMAANEISSCFSPEAATRIAFALVSESGREKMKAVLQWIGVLFDECIPEADIPSIDADCAYIKRLDEALSSSKKRR